MANDGAWRQWRFRARNRGGRPEVPGPEAPRPLAAGETAQSIYDRLMKDTFAPGLRELGFTGSAGRFELKQDPDTWRLLGFQKSAYSDRDEVRFTLNLSTIAKDAWARNKPPGAAKPSPSTFYGSWARQTRIGDVLPDPADKWWRVMPGQDVEALAADVFADIRDHALPWLRRDEGGPSLA